MGYKIDFDKNHAMEEMLLELLKRCSFSLDVMERMLGRIYNTNCVKCEASGHLKEFIRDVIMGTMIPATREAINLFADETRYYVYGMYNLDRSLHVKVEEDYFPDLMDRLNGVLGDTMDTLAACRTVMDSIYDILPLEPKSTEAMEAAFEGLYNMENGVQNSFTDYLEEFMVRAGRMQDAVNGAYTLVSERAMGDIHMDEYDGSYRNDASLQELRQTLADVRADIGHTDDAKAAMETMQAEVYQLYDMEEFAEDQLLYIGGIAVGTISMIVAPWATAPLLSFASGAFATLYSVDQADQGNQMYDAVQGWDTDVEIHPVVEIENPVFNMMYHIAGNMALDHSLDVGLQAGNRFMKWRKEMDGLGMPDNVNIAEDVWHMDAGDVNPLHGADDVADMNTGHAGQANTGGVTHLDDADNVAGVNTGCTPQQANAGGVTHLDDADNVAGVSAGHAKQQVNAGGVTHLDDVDNVAGVSAGHAQQQANVAHIKGGSDSVAYHSVGGGNASKKIQSVLDGIDISYTSPDSRFGQGFYVSAKGDTTIAELAYHGTDATYSIRYDMNLEGQKVLDLTNPSVALDWGYIQNESSLLECQSIAERALDEGYSVIKVQSYRGDGVNYIIYDNFDDILSPQMVTPIPK